MQISSNPVQPSQLQQQMAAPKSPSNNDQSKNSDLFFKDSLTKPLPPSQSNPNNRLRRLLSPHSHIYRSEQPGDSKTLAINRSFESKSKHVGLNDAGELIGEELFLDKKKYLATSIVVSEKATLFLISKKGWASLQQHLKEENGLNQFMRLCKLKNRFVEERVRMLEASSSSIHVPDGKSKGSFGNPFKNALYFPTEPVEDSLKKQHLSSLLHSGVKKAVLRTEVLPSRNSGLQISSPNGKLVQRRANFSPFLPALQHHSSEPELNWASLNKLKRKVKQVSVKYLESINDMHKLDMGALLKNRKLHHRRFANIAF